MCSRNKKKTLFALFIPDTFIFCKYFILNILVFNKTKKNQTKYPSMIKYHIFNVYKNVLKISQFVHTSKIFNVIRKMKHKV